MRGERRERKGSGWEVEGEGGAHNDPVLRDDKVHGSSCISMCRVVDGCPSNRINQINTEKRYREKRTNQQIKMSSLLSHVSLQRHHHDLV